MPANEEFIVEFYQVGQAVKVTAMDTKTLTEVSIVGDPKYSRDHLTNLAIRKLKYVLSKS